MADPSPPTQQPAAGSTLVIAPELLEKFPELIALIKASESMNDEERQYWINILPIMTPEQIQNLRDILDNEKKQLQAIDQKYAKEIERIGQGEVVRQTEEERKNRRAARQQAEQSHMQDEAAAANALLQQIET